MKQFETIELFEDMPQNLTYPLIQPVLMEEYLKKNGVLLKVEE